jgi:hypothetical protein
MGVGQKAQDAYGKYKKVKKAAEYYGAIKKTLDEDTRSEGLLKLGVKGLLDLSKKLVGDAVAKHPYFTYHKAHLEVLGQALTASDTFDHAMQALNGAIASADSAQALTGQLTDLTHRKNGLKFTYGFTVSGGMQLLRDTSPQAAVQLKDAGQSRESLRATMDRYLYDWRAETCALYFEAADLLAMTDLEYRAADAAFARYNDKVRKLQASKNNLGRIAGSSAEYQKQLEWASRELDRAFNRSAHTPDPQAVLNPAAHAQRQRDKVEAVVQKLATMCDAAMSDDAYNPQAMNLRIGTL